MNKIIRWYNQNREFFFIVIAIIAFIIIIIQVLNSIIGSQNEQKKNEGTLENSSTNTSTTISEPNKSVITGEELPTGNAKTNESIIKQFIGYCNNEQIEEAYNMLSDECKKLLYPSMEKFKTNYYEKIFYIKRMYELENWYSYDNMYTYNIKYTEDVLATGNINSQDNRTEYITVVRSENDYKLNINNYVGREKFQKTVSENNISVTVNWLDMYIDYTIANISVKNNTSNAICLDTKEDTSTTYLYDAKGVKYTAMMNEIALEQLIVRRSMTNTLNIKFSKIFNPERELTGIRFRDVVLNYENYNNQVEEKNSIVIDIDI